MDQILEVGNHFRRAAGQIDRRDVGFREPVDHPIDRFAGHDFFTLRSGVHMAMNADEVAELADIDLQDLRSSVAQGKGVLDQFARETVVRRQLHFRYRSDHER